jgi:hypothetical protein
MQSFYASANLNCSLGDCPVGHAHRRCSGSFVKAESEDWKWVPGIEKLMPPPMNQGGVDRAVVVPPSCRATATIKPLMRPGVIPIVMGRLKNPQAVALLPKLREQPGMLGVRLTLLGRPRLG